MAQTREQTPVHLALADGMVCGPSDARRVLESHTDLATDFPTAKLYDSLASANTPRERDEAMAAFRQWAEEQGILLTHDRSAESAE